VVKPNLKKAPTMKKGQRSLFDDMPSIGGTPYPTERPAVMDDPFAQPSPAKKFIKQFVGKKTKKGKFRNSPDLIIPPRQPGPGGKQIIFGTIPSKSNCYVIITMKPKKDAPKKTVECPDCDGKGYPMLNHACSTCSGSGLIQTDPKGHASLAKSAALKKYENDFYIQCNQYRNKMIDGYFQVEVDVYYPNQRSDLDNSLKVLLDCLQHIKAYKNDSKCTRIVANKFLDKVNPRIEFEIKPV
jgi:Holliday junction resolvase RusA-like endonuclease